MRINVIFSDVGMIRIRFSKILEPDPNKNPFNSDPQHCSKNTYTHVHCSFLVLRKTCCLFLQTLKAVSTYQVVLKSHFSNSF